MSFIAKELRNQDGCSNLRLRNYVSNKHKLLGKSFLMAHLIQNIEEIKNDRIVISGIRHVEEINLLIDRDFQVVAYYVYDSLVSRLKKTIKRDERSSIKEFFVEEYYSYKWKDKKIKKVVEIIDKRKETKALEQLISSLVGKQII
ncbi:hypothetical protein [Flagellimonas sp.]|uniref:hypothetical protein n=1 Tax=Flagellimonas sp. TaxID=2058762 RepID=UPI003B5C8675